MRRIPLSVRLAVGAAVVVAAVVGVLTLVTGISLRGYLVAEVDDELRGVTTRAVRALESPLPGPGGAVGVPGQAPGTIAAYVQDGVLTIAAVLDQGGDADDADEATVAALATAVDGERVGASFSASAGPLGDYRFTSVELSDGSVLILGLPLAEVDAVVVRHSLLAASIGAVVLVLVTAGSWVLGANLQRAQRRLETALSAREAGERRLRDFAADASHELRTPLAAIRGYAELTRRSGARIREDVAHSLERIEAESIRMTGLVEDLLMLARLDSQADSGEELAKQQVDLASVVATAVGDIQTIAPDHAWSVDAPEPVVVPADAGRIHQAVVNLVANAASHTPAGTSVVARVRRDGSDGVIEVVDDGPGIPEDVLPNVYGRFVRGEASRSRAHGSTGLGLAIVQAIAEAHGGTASVESRPGRTAFTIRLPAR